MSEKQSLEFTSDIDTTAAASHLEALAQGLRDGRILIESGDRSLSLEVGGSVSVDLEAKSNPDKGRSSIEVKLSWVAEEEVEEVVPPSLLIASGTAAVEHETSSY
jgi:amphi-Trp domain-containing protein